MRLPITLSIYVGRQFLLAVLSTLAVMIAIIGLIELLEVLRRASNAPRSIPFQVVLEMVLLKLPTLAEKIYPFAFLIGGMITLSRLTRSNELIVARSAGISVWQFVMPGVLVALSLGVFFVAIMSPIAAATISRFERIDSKYITGRVSVLTVFPSGLWLRQVGEDQLDFRGQRAEEYILTALRMDPASLKLSTVTMFLFASDHRFIGRFDAPEATLDQGRWNLPEAILSAPGILPQTQRNFSIPTQLTINQIQDSFAAPETFSFWQLPGFIKLLEKAGFSALKHRLHFHSLVALPTLLAGMLLLSGVFTLRQTRRGKTGALIAVGMAAGFGLYFATNLIYALGANGDLPVILAAWAPSLMVNMFAISALLHLEDG
jgi:lipopolysaccharide export system permease protein